MKVIGVGFGRTGTMSLKYALERIGAGPCLHMIDLIRNHDLIEPWHDAVVKGHPPDWDRMLAGFDSTIDWPGCTFWRELTAAYPDVPVLLNTREFDGWYKSCQNTIYALRQAALTGQLEPGAGTEDPPPPELWQIIGKLIWERDFQGRFEDVDWMRRMYAERIETIRAAIPAERLILLPLEESPGWAPICDMLGVEEPDEPFPHLHDTNEFRTEFGLAPV